MTRFCFVAILSLASLCNCNADLIDHVCTKSSTPSLYIHSLRSNPRSRGADDHRGLGQITIHKARAATRVTQGVAESLSAGGTKAKANACVEYCTDAIELLNDFSTLLRHISGGISIDDLKTKGSAALTDISMCDDKFGSGEPSKPKKASPTTQDLMDIFLVIANLL